MFSAQNNCNVIDKFQGVIVIQLKWCNWSNSAIRNKNRKFSCVLYAHSQFLCSLSRFNLANRGVRQTAQSHTFCAPLQLLDETLAQPHFEVVSCSDAVMCVFYSYVLTLRLIFLQLW